MRNPVFLLLVIVTLVNAQKKTFVEGAPSEWEIPCEEATDCPLTWSCFTKYSICIPPIVSFGDSEVLYSPERTVLSGVNQSVVTCSTDQDCQPTQHCDRKGHCLEDLNAA